MAETVVTHKHNIWLCHCDLCGEERKKIFVNTAKETMSKVKKIDEASKKAADSTLRFP